MIIKLHQNLCLDEKVILERIVFKPPLRAPGTMKNEACFVYALEGQTSFFDQLSSGSLVTGESALMRCGRYINNWMERKDDLNNEIVLIHLYPNILRTVYADGIPEFLKGRKQKTKKFHHVVKRQEAISNYIKGLIFYFDNPQLTNDEFVKLKLREFLLLLHNLGNEELDFLLSDLFDEREIEFKEVIQSNLYEPLSISELAYMCNLSLSSFKRKFSETYGVPPGKYIASSKLEKALELLKHTNQSIGDVSFEAGYNDPKHFSKKFKMRYGKSPSEFRKEFRVGTTR